MSNQLQFRTVISVRREGFVVERQAEGKLIDRYYTTDLTLPRKSPAWAAEVSKLFSQEPANVIIPTFVIPPIAETLESKLTRLSKYEQDEQERAMKAQHDAEFKLAQALLDMQDENFVREQGNVQCQNL